MQVARAIKVGNHSYIKSVAYLYLFPPSRFIYSEDFIYTLVTKNKLIPKHYYYNM